MYTNTSKWLLHSFEEYQSLTDELKQRIGAPQAALNVKCAELIKTWFSRKLVMIEDYYATGDPIVEELQRQTPAGFLNRIIGVCKPLKVRDLISYTVGKSGNSATKRVRRSGADRLAASRGLNFLGNRKVFGQLFQHKVEVTLRQLPDDPNFRRRQDDVCLDSIQSTLTSSADTVQPQVASSTQQQYRAKDTLLDVAESLFDLADSVRRRKRADLIYKDLTHERIIVKAAIAELRIINKRQKKGD